MIALLVASAQLAPLCAAKPELQLYTGISATAPLEYDLDEYKFKYNVGVKVKFGALSVNVIDGMATTSAKDLSGMSFSGFLERQKVRYGASYALSTPYVNVEASVGALRFSQGVSRLKNPLFSFSSALTKPSAPGAGISVSLPSWASAAKPLAAALEISGGERLAALPAVQLAATREGEFFGSVSKKFSARHLPSGSASVTGGIFRYGKSASDTRRGISLDAELNLTFPHFRLFTAAGLSKCSRDATYFWRRARCYIPIGDFALHMFVFGVDPKAVYAGGKQPGTALQAALNPQYTFWFGKLSLGTGVLLYAALKEDAEPSVVRYTEYKGRCDISLSAPKYKLAFCGKVSCDTSKDRNLDCYAKLALTNYLDSMRIASYVTYKRVYEKADFAKSTVTASCSFSPKDFALKAAGIKASFTQKPGEASLSASAVTKFEFTAGFFKMSVQITIKDALKWTREG